MGIRAGLGPRRGGGIHERLEVGLRARAGETATASLGDDREGVGLGGEDEDGRKREERWRRNSRRKGEREVEEQGGRKTKKKRPLFIYFFYLVSFLVVVNLVWAARGERRVSLSLTRNNRNCAYICMVSIYAWCVLHK